MARLKGEASKLKRTLRVLILFSLEPSLYQAKFSLRVKQKILVLSESQSMSEFKVPPTSGEGSRERSIQKTSI